MACLRFTNLVWPLRPILAAYNTATYKLAKHLVPLLEPFSSNNFTIKNSYKFKETLKSLNLPATPFMCSFDVTSLFTNIPLVETIEIICSEILTQNDTFHGFNRSSFKELLSLAVSEPLFMFHGGRTIYRGMV